MNNYKLVSGEKRGEFVWEGPCGFLYQRPLPDEIVQWLDEHEALAKAKPERPSYHHTWTDGEWRRE